ncbi:MAG: DUF421 domain-containing protein [Syntrophotaleaceae bacterium]
MEHLFFDSWSVLLRTMAIGVLAYASLIFFLRVTGKRTLSKMNAFDFVVTVAFGSTLATILLSKDVALAQGALALALLVGLQYVITWSSVRIGWFRRLVTGEPSLLFFAGEYLIKSMRNARVTRDEIRAAVRSAGFASLAEVEAVVMETDGSFSVIRRSENPDFSSFEGITNAEQAKEKSA